ncbi:hypothetical protein PC118_g14233 [Phytophthora cactorum]|uniref:Uncharacterized protein n=1 Tax=Phytophthora cactorum TaxID=29920 RepID=A0A8T1FLP1_9STRA|nr:hypothetical protein PC118_g14233 [Phytophthora cactorum]
MPIDSLGGSPETPYTAIPRRPAVPQQYFGQQQPGYEIPMSRLQRLYTATASHLQWCHSTRTDKSMLELELYVGLVSGFLERGRRFERQVNNVQSACGFAWPHDVKVDLLGHYLPGIAERYYHKQVEAWWVHLPTLQYVMEMMLEAFKTNITPAQAMKLFTAP